MTTTEARTKNGRAVSGKAKKKDKLKKSKAEKKKRRKAKRLTAKTADRHRLYQASVQAPEVDTQFVDRFFRRYAGEPARILREDFCGTAVLACHWVKLHRDNRAIGVDLDGPTLDWGREHNFGDLLDEEQRERVTLLQEDVRTASAPRADVTVAFNFSYMIFKSRDSLRGYFESARRGLRKGGALILDAWGGSETQVEQEEERPVEGFTYVWDQAEFDPITGHSTCRIHFEFKDGTRIRNAFKYEWRLWTLPELQELLIEAGFEDVHVLWEGTEAKTGEGNGRYRRVTRGDADPAWIAYLVGRA